MSTNVPTNRVLVADTETTGFSTEDGDKIVEVGFVELIDRKLTGNTFHAYIDPGFEIPEDSVNVHGLTREDVVHLGSGQTFPDIAKAMIEFIDGDELVFHNAPFDMGFLDAELQACGQTKLSDLAPVFDTLRFAGMKFPGQRNNLNALCKRFGIDTSERNEHGALLDASLLAEAYLALTRHQSKLDLDNQDAVNEQLANNNLLASIERLEGTGDLPVIHPSHQEIEQHQAYLGKIADKASTTPHWQPDPEPTSDPDLSPAPF